MLISFIRLYEEIIDFFIIYKKPEIRNVYMNIFLDKILFTFNHNSTLVYTVGYFEEYSVYRI
jgi:hypothetical protein